MDSNPVPEETDGGNGAPESSTPDRKDPVGILALPVMLTVPESCAVVTVGAGKLKIPAPETAAEPRLAVVRVEESNVVSDVSD